MIWHTNVKFKGIDAKDQWHYGDLLHIQGRPYIVESFDPREIKMTEVRWVRQFAGVKDFYETEVYFGDYIQNLEDDTEPCWEVENKVEPEFYNLLLMDRKSFKKNGYCWHLIDTSAIEARYKVIGNSISTPHIWKNMIED